MMLGWELPKANRPRQDALSRSAKNDASRKNPEKSSTISCKMHVRLLGTAEFSKHASNWVLNGGEMLCIWSSPETRGS